MSAQRDVAENVAVYSGTGGLPECYRRSVGMRHPPQCRVPMSAIFSPIA
jgi:hypothetical protein